MKAKETQATELFSPGQQLTVPVWQRPYTWVAEQWTELWHDITRLRGDKDGKLTHFLGSVVVRTERYEGLPGEGKRFALVDGQQRVATLTVLLIAIRDLIGQQSDQTQIDALTNQLFVSAQNSEGHRRRLVLQASDEPMLAALLEGRSAGKGRILDCHRHYMKELRGETIEELRKLVGLIQTRLDVVWISLAESDNAHRVFQTINAGGKPLRQIDLVRNFFFLLLGHQGEEFYGKHWKALESQFDESKIEKYFSAWLIAQGHKGETDKLFYYFNKDLSPHTTSPKHVWRYGEKLAEESSMFAIILGKAKDSNPGVEKQMQQLRQWGTKPVEGLIFYLFRLRADGRLRAQDLEQCLSMIYSFFARRLLAGYEPNLHRSILVQVANKLFEHQAVRNQDLVLLLKVLLSRGSELKTWPSNEAVLTSVIKTSIYTKARRHWAKSVLGLYNSALFANPKQAPTPEAYSDHEVEHILPQRPGSQWQRDLRGWGVPDPMELVRGKLHVLGNLSLTSINQELSNRPLVEKLKLIQDDTLKINAKLKSVESWTETSIDERSRQMAVKLLEVLDQPLTEAEIKNGQFADVCLPDEGDEEPDSEAESDHD